jgi:hypothetical protein
MADEVANEGAHEVPLESLAEKKEDPKQSEAQYKALFVPEGGYLTVVPQDVRARVNEKGLTNVSFFGAWMGLDGKAALAGEQQGQRFMVSPDQTTKEDGKLGFLFARYVEAKKAYKDTFGEWPENAHQVIDYLRTYPVKLRVRMGNDGPLVVGITAYKQ